ncbi:response regulator transcription factor [Paenibacillus sp. 1P07SE]|uniref:response regulator transcription factor n=1 Tax=Paenibacillus sp. 1P07SE TaxID=3132209 RepID=UPI0039A64402
MKICIAEDELKVRETIVRKLERVSLCPEVFDVGYGREALDKIIRIQPQLVITDIQMPELDGLEVLQQVKERLHDTQVVLLTGYSDFEYARKAVKYGAFDYLLKPVASRQLEEMLLRIRGHFAGELQTQLQPVLSQLAAEGAAIEELRPLRPERWFDKTAPKKLELGASAAQDLQDTEEDKGAAVIFSFAMAGGYSGRVSIAKHAEDHTFVKSDEFVLQLAEARQRLETERFMGRPAERSASTDNYAIRECKTCRDRVMDAARDRDDRLTEQWLQRWFEAAASLRLPALHVESAYLMAMLDEGLISGSRPRVIEKEKADYWLEWVRQWPSWQELSGRIAHVVLGGIRALEEARLAQEQPGKTVVQQAEQLLVRHHGVISLEAAAAKLQVHPVALSRMFKQETGTAFVHQATSLRMKQAARLLLTTDKLVGEIAGESGYQDSKYFSQLFRKAYGCTPGEYRRQNH